MTTTPTALAATEFGSTLAASPRTQLPDSVCDLPGAAASVCQYRQFGEFGGTAAGTVANSGLDALVDALLNGVTKLLQLSLTWWIDLPSPQLTTQNGSVLATVRGYTTGLQVLLMIAGILFAAARLAMAKRGGAAGEAQETFLMFARAVMAATMFAAVITTGTRAGDAFSDWVIFDAAGGDAKNVVARLAEFELRTDSGLGSGVLLVVGLLGVISMLVQLVMLVVRQALLILVVAALPIAAAASGTGPGSQAYKRMLGWALAFVLWKPVGALCYAIAFTAAGTNSAAGQQDPQLVLLGLLLLLMVAVVLPGLMRLIAPAVATLGGGGGAAATLAGGAIGVAMGRAGGDRSEARKVTEGDGAPGGGSAPPAGAAPPGPSGGGGGGRATSGGASGGGSAPGGGGASGTSGSTGGQAARTPSGGGSAGAKQAGKVGAGGAGGALIGGAVAAKHAVQQTGSVVESQTREATEAGWDPDALGPREVRR
ncbi:hypothetical protein BJY24_005782 [Nocardia transvalensis]|uniref:TrbL/VirB6 plasmid conjugal transfer protein n=1 Tax=Nocardia transvalensis TaxID=37333 RepID=A0A7W9PJ46_9NOCA|nr:hypothetical protein [Nocardia transvalensis]MBB5916870.1 hypothetical protein [Nocardia transvalensis]